MHVTSRNLYVTLQTVFGNIIPKILELSHGGIFARNIHHSTLNYSGVCFKKSSAIRHILTLSWISSKIKNHTMYVTAHIFFVLQITNCRKKNA